MSNINNYNQARLELESRFFGLPHTHTTLIKSLISRADPTTGLVEGLNYRDLADILKVDHAPGRKGCGTPQKQTIRSYLRTIEDNCGDNFRLISFGQKIKFHFIQMPKIYAYFFGQNESYIDGAAVINSSKHLDKHETFNTIDVIPEPVKSFNLPGEGNLENDAKKVLYITKTNKQTGEEDENLQSTKKPISPDFYPDDETIAIAMAKGFTAVTDAAELSAFIRHNERRNTQWIDFNPVYLQWLERGFEYQQRKQAATFLRNQNHGHYRNASTRKSPVELVRELYPDAESPSGKPWGAIDAEPHNTEALGVGMVGVDELIRAAFHEQTRRENQRCMA